MSVAELRSSVQQALLGEVTANLFALTVGIEHERRLRIDAYYLGPPTEEDSLRMEEVATEIVADHPALDDVAVRCIDVTPLEELPTLTFWAFARAHDERTSSKRFV